MSFFSGVLFLSLSILFVSGRVEHAEVSQVQNHPADGFEDTGIANQPTTTTTTTTPTEGTTSDISCSGLGGICLSIYSRIYCPGQKRHSGCYDNQLQYCCLQL
ncbi:hypothetical protein V1264_007902 [Littorina saxatilis]|uniref:Uncharacterized protein n=1 Tax=Littorina saxatilis TaxID=31220 RepID=A0AAN9AWD4_9CAEN